MNVRRKRVEVTQEPYGYRRTNERIACSLRGSYVSADNIAHPLECVDISRHGAGVVSDEHLPLNTQIRADFCTHRGSQIFLEGSICWCRKAFDRWQAGIRFNKPLPYHIGDLV